MSEYIKLDEGAVSSKDLRKAKTALNKAISAMNEAENSLSNSWYKYNSTGASSFFTSDFIREAGTIGSSLEGFKEKLEKYARLLDSGPEEIIEADRDFKGQKSNAWQRTMIAIGGGIGGLFKHGGNKTGNNTTSVGEESQSETNTSKSKKILLEVPQNTRTKQKYSGDCCATAYAAGLSIITGESHDSDKYYVGGECNWGDGNVKDETTSFDDSSCKTIYQNLKAGKPTIVHYTHGKSGTQGVDWDNHYVLVVGIKDGADLNNLTLDDFIFLDPADGQVKEWKDCHSKEGGKTPRGIVEFT